MRNTGNALERYQEVVDIILDRKKLKDCTYINEETYIEDKITNNGNDWTFKQHKIINAKPILDDFKKMVSDYLA